MSQTTTLELSSESKAPRSAASITFDSARSSGSLESSSSTSTSASAPSLSTIHSSSSAPSSTRPSPCPSILIHCPSLTFPSRSASASPNVTFAPLPHIDVRKRNPSHQLGVAARSRLLRHRRILRERGFNPDDPHSYPYGPGSGVAGGKNMVDCFGADDPVEVREAQAGVDTDEEADARYHRARARSDPAEDALISLGRLVKGAGKTLWRSLSMRELRPKESEVAALGEGKAEEGGEGEVQTVPRQHHSEERKSFSHTPHPVAKKKGHLFEEQDVSPHSEEGGVWEEEIPEEAWKRLFSKADDARPSTDSARKPSSSSSPPPSPISGSSAKLASRRTSVVEAIAKPSKTTRVR